MDKERLQLLIRAKGFDSKQTFKLLEVSRRETADEIIEELLDVIADEQTYTEYEAKISNLEEEIDDLESKNNGLKTEIESLNQKNEQEEKKIISDFQEFVEKFKKENNRYPSIDETWSMCSKNFIKVSNNKVNFITENTVQ